MSLSRRGEIILLLKKLLTFYVFSNRFSAFIFSCIGLNTFCIAMANPNKPDGENTNAVVGGRLAKGGSALTGGGSQLFAWGEKDKLSTAFLQNIEKILPSIPAVAPSADTATAQSGSVAEEIKKLLALKDSGILTEAEFETAKRRLLND